MQLFGLIIRPCKLGPSNNYSDWDSEPDKEEEEVAHGAVEKGDEEPGELKGGVMFEWGYGDEDQHPPAQQEQEEENK
jgi:hypothetical protein